MALQKQKKERKGFFAMIFLVDPWRKLAALALGFLAWFYISRQILETKHYEFTVVSIAQGSTDYKGSSLNVPVPDGFVLWKVGGIPLSKKPKIVIRFKGPRNRMRNVTEYLQIAVAPRKLEKLSLVNKKIEITSSDLVIPRHPQLNELIDAIVTPDGKVVTSVVLEFQRYLTNKLFILSESEIPYRITEFPQGYERDTQRQITLSPSEIYLSGPESIINEELKNKPVPKRPPLFEEFVIHRGLRIHIGKGGNPEFIIRVKLKRFWEEKGVKIEPKGGVEVHFPIRRKAFIIDIPKLRIPIEFTGENAQKWEFMEGEHKTRHVIVKVFNYQYWLWGINKITRFSTERKENKKAQEEWVKKHVRLFVNVSLLDPKKGKEPRAPIHWVVLTDPDDLVDKSDIIVEITESDRVGVQLKREKKAGKSG